MVNEAQMLTDDVEDEIQLILSQMNEMVTWTSKKRKLREKLLEKLASEKYVSFSASNPNRYHIQAVGQHYLYDVPLYKQGVLKKFRGKRVRIVCTESGNHTWRGFMAGAVSDTPEDKVVKRLIDSYFFPAPFDVYEIAYQSPRFRALKIGESDRFQQGGRYIDTQGFDGLIIDGRSGKIIALTNVVDSSKIEARGLYQAYTTTHESFRSVIDRYAS